VEINCPECLTKNCKNATISNGKCLNFSPDNIKYYQHKFYRSILLPEITDAMGEISTQYVHDFKLKPLWIFNLTGNAFYEYEKYMDIPDKYRKSERAKIWILDNTHFAVIPSMSGFTIKEAKSFIEFCEKLLFMDLQGSIRRENESEYVMLKGKIK